MINQLWINRYEPRIQHYKHAKKPSQTQTSTAITKRKSDLCDMH